MFIRRFECFTYMNYIYVKFNMDIATQMTSQGDIKIQHLIKNKSTVVTKFAFQILNQYSLKWFSKILSAFPDIQRSRFEQK